MNIQKFSGGEYLTNGYVVYDKGEAVAIDVPAHTAKKIHEFLEENKLTLTTIIATHVHWDHVEDAHRLHKLTGAKFALHALDEQNQYEINSIFEDEAGQIKSDFNVDENDKIKVGTSELEILHTPGHTPGSICLYNAKKKILFSGDTVFERTHGRIDFPLSSPEDMKKSLQKLSELPADTKIYPGHGAETSIGKEKWLKE